ncbi:MAG: hypothetical protein U0800_15815 [Isosphaeraceae bacterium]
MSADAKSKTGAADPTADLGQFWAQWMEQSARGTQALLEAMQGATDPDVWQKRWLSAMEGFFEDYLRSPAYLETMRRTLKTITDAKLAQDQAVHGVARHLGMPLADDISGLFERLHGHETKVLAKLEAIEERLEAIEEAVLGPQGSPNGTNGIARRRRPGSRGKTGK